MNEQQDRCGHVYPGGMRCRLGVGAHGMPGMSHYVTAEQRGSDESGEGLGWSCGDMSAHAAHVKVGDGRPCDGVIQPTDAERLSLVRAIGCEFHGPDYGECSSCAGRAEQIWDEAVDRILRARAASAEAALATARREVDELRGRLAAVDIAAILDAHLPGDYTHLFHDDPGTVDPPVGCRCGWRRERGVSQHDHLAAVLRAALANPSAAQGEAEVERRTPGVYGFGDPQRWIDDTSTDAPEASQ